jgi:hypothetical protein
MSTSHEAQILLRFCLFLYLMCHTTFKFSCTKTVPDYLPREWYDDAATNVNSLF